MCVILSIRERERERDRERERKREREKQLPIADVEKNVPTPDRQNDLNDEARVEVLRSLFLPHKFVDSPNVTANLSIDGIRRRLSRSATRASITRLPEVGSITTDAVSLLLTPTPLSSAMIFSITAFDITTPSIKTLGRKTLSIKLLI